MRPPVKIIKDFLIVAVLAYSVTFGLAGFAQEKQEPGKDEKTVTMKIVKDDNGKVTVIDTTFTTKGKGKGKQYEYEYTIQDVEKDMKDVEEHMRDLEDQMKHFEVQVRMGDEMEDLDSVIRLGDSIEKHYIIKGMGHEGGYPCPAPGVWFGDEGGGNFSFDFNDGDFDFPAFPMPPQWEALLQSIPKGNITGFRIKDRKDGKRIIIDIDDEMPMVIMAPYFHRGMGHGKGHGAKKIIIERNMNEMDVPPPPPPPPPDAPKEKSPKPEKG